MPRNFGGRSNSRSRSSGSSSRSGQSYSRPSQGYSSYSSRPQPANPGPTSVRGPGMFGGSGLGSTIAHGMAFGGGSEIGHQITRSMFGGHHVDNYHQPIGQVSQEAFPQNDPRNVQNTQKPQNPCLEFNYKFVDCLKMTENDISKCQSLFDDLKACEKKFL